MHQALNTLDIEAVFLKLSAHTLMNRESVLKIAEGAKNYKQEADDSVDHDKQWLATCSDDERYRFVLYMHILNFTSLAINSKIPRIYLEEGQIVEMLATHFNSSAKNHQGAESYPGENLYLTLSEASTELAKSLTPVPVP